MKLKDVEKKLIIIKFVKNIHVINNFKVNLLTKIKKIIGFLKKKHSFHEILKCINIYIIYEFVKSFERNKYKKRLQN